MFKRLFWLAVGVGLGFGLSIWTARAVRRTAERYTPESVAGRVAGSLRDLRRELREAVREGRAAMADKEAELRTQLERRPPPGFSSKFSTSGVENSLEKPVPMDRGADPARN